MKRNWKVGDRVSMTEVSIGGFRRVYCGTIKWVLPHDMYAVCFDGNKIGATQNIRACRLLKIEP